MIIIKPTYTNRIKILREKEKLTQEEFIKKMNYGLSNTLLSGIENGKKPLSLKLALEIAQIFDVSLDWLYELKDDETDEASKTIISLRKIFKLYRDEATDNIAIRIDNNLLNFLLELAYADKIKTQTQMPEEAYKSWIVGIKEKYNQAIENNTEDEPVNYVLFSDEDFSKYLEKRLNEKLKQVRGLPSNLNHLT